MSCVTWNAFLQFSPGVIFGIRRCIASTIFRLARQYINILFQSREYLPLFYGKRRATWNRKIFRFFVFVAFFVYSLFAKAIFRRKIHNKITIFLSFWIWVSFLLLLLPPVKNILLYIKFNCRPNFAVIQKKKKLFFSVFSRLIFIRFIHFLFVSCLSAFVILFLISCFSPGAQSKHKNPFCFNFLYIQYTQYTKTRKILK